MFEYRSEPRLNGRGYFMGGYIPPAHAQGCDDSDRFRPAQRLAVKRSTLVLANQVNQTASVCAGGNNSPRILRRAVGKTGL
jgi:hypothetical protein